MTCDLQIRSAVDYLDFSIIWTCFCGPSFSWILISHISCLQQNYFALNYAIKLEVVSLQSTNFNVFNSHTHQNQYSACFCALIVSDLLCCWVKFHLLFSKLFSFALTPFIFIFSITRTRDYLDHSAIWTCNYLDHSAQSPWVRSHTRTHTHTHTQR